MPYNTPSPIRLTHYSSGAGCGCKIAPAVLETILRVGGPPFDDPHLMVGYGSRDDAAVYDIGNGEALISTVDFFSPIVDDAMDFGRIAAANALSDVYAMGGTPLMAVAVLGWPVEKLPAAMAGQVVEGGRQKCAEAGIVLAGGHSIDSPEPFFGLAVSGRVGHDHLKRNDTAQTGDLIVLTRALGSGVLSTAMKRGLVQEKESRAFIRHLSALNSIGAQLGRSRSVTAMTDVTGFGLFGHLLEMSASTLSAVIEYDRVPLLEGVQDLLKSGCYADGALRNWKSYHNQVSGAEALAPMMVGSDPQTNGGLLLALDPNGGDEVLGMLKDQGVACSVIGRFEARGSRSAVQVR
ncbi:MAG: selenide, water dikinase SelD [Flavobacteriales bacterium]|nr:selenide, water dikinase SelD [Flavobacteriales bacterium]MCB9167959.1 selenide, water dikinase SelD [Flavobacteriales bacterium]